MEALLAPDQTANNGDTPGHVVTGDKQREQRIGGDRVDQTQETKDDGNNHQSDDGVHRLPSDATTDMAE